METGVMSSGAGEGGGLVNEQVQIQRTPAAVPSVQARPRLADFPSRNNRGRSPRCSSGGSKTFEKSLLNLVLISGARAPKSSSVGALRGAIHGGARRRGGVARPESLSPPPARWRWRFCAGRWPERTSGRAAATVGAAPDDTAPTGNVT